MRFTPQQKLEIIRRYLRLGISVYSLCREHNISKVTFYKWLALYKRSRKNWIDALSSKVRRGKLHPKSLDYKQKLAILGLVHKHPEYSSHKIAEVLGVGNFGVQSFLYKDGLNKYEDRLAFSSKPFWTRQSVQSREGMMDLYSQGWNVTDICHHFKISKPIFYKWKRRWEAAREGQKVQALADRYVTGSAHHKYLDESKKEQVVELVKTNPELSVHKIHRQLAGVVGHYTVQEVLRREGLNTYENRLRFAQGYSKQPEIEIAPLYIPQIPLYKLRHLIAHFATVPKLLVTQPKKGIVLGFVTYSPLFLLIFWLMFVLSSDASPIGLFFASTALIFGLFFFIYSMKYYISTLMVLKLAQGGGVGESSKLKVSSRGGSSVGGESSKLWKLLSKPFSLSPRSRVNPLLINLEKVELNPGERPFVSVHVAMYNEKRVVERLIRACEAQEWGVETIDSKQLTIDKEDKKSSVNGQVSNVGAANYEVVIADDSTDETTAMAKEILSSDGRILDRILFNEEMEIYVSSPPVGSSLPVIKLIHRFSRSGFKGGALQKALENTNPKAQYITIFDADFVPYPDTIEQFVKTFQVLTSTTSSQGTTSTTSSNEKARDTRDTLDARDTLNIAAVQGYQWHVLNKSQNWVTRGVRTEYAGSYVIERAGEEIYGGLKQIAGSVYMIRADILRQFGWGKSITEDFELTLRLYEKGYKVAFTPYIQAPAEAVSTLKRLIRQRMRWAEGASFNIKVMLPRMLFGRWEAAPNNVILGSETTPESDSGQARMTGESQNDNEGRPSLSDTGSAGERRWVPSRLTRTEKLEFAYLAPYYLQAAFFIIGTFSWFISETIIGTRLPFWTAALGWSLVFTNLLALPLMNIVGMFLEESDERDYIGILSFIALSYIVVPFQAYAAIKGFLETEEGPWFRTPKTGLITDTLGRSGFSKFFGNILGREAAAPVMHSGDLFTPGVGQGAALHTPGVSLAGHLALATSNAASVFRSLQGNSFRIKPRRMRMVGRSVLVALLIFAISLNIVSFNQNGYFNGVGQRFLGGQEIEIAGRNVFAAGEKPSFELKVPREENETRIGALLRRIRDFGEVRAQETPNLKASLIDPKGQTTDVSEDIASEEDNFRLTLNERDNAKPGKYTLNVQSIDANGNLLGQAKQDFSWGVLAINTNKSIYTPGEVAKLGFGTLDDEGRTICSAKLSLEITSPDSEKTILSSENEQIKPSGLCTQTSVTNTADYLAEYQTTDVGIYKLHLKAETQNGERAIDDQFEVRESVPFDIERTSYPTRIYPPVPYDVTLTIVANEDFRGEVVETVPDSFEIENQKVNSLSYSSSDPANGGRVEKFSTSPSTMSSGPNGSNNKDQKLLSWQVDWKKGEKHELRYTIKFPNVSPEFYLVGPLRLLAKNAVILGSKATPGSERNPDSGQALRLHSGQFKGSERSRIARMTENVVFAEARQWQIASDASATFIESGSDATQGSEWYSASLGTPVSATAQKNTGPRSWEMQRSATSDSLDRAGVLADAGRRISAWVRFTSFPSADQGFIATYTSAGAIRFGLRVTPSGTLYVINSSAASIGTGSLTLSTGTWYQFQIAYIITNSTTNEIRIRVDRTLDISITNGSGVSTGTDLMSFGWLTSGGSGETAHFDDFYIDDDTSLADMGDTRVTYKAPATGVHSNFDNPGFVSDVTERPLNTALYSAHVDTTQVHMDYTIQTAATGDVDMSGNTIVAKSYWVYAQDGAGANGTPKIVYDNDSESAVSLTTTPTLFSQLQTSTTYPTASGSNIGMESTGAGADTYMFEAGVLIAFAGAPVPEAVLALLPLSFAVPKIIKSIQRGTLVKDFLGIMSVILEKIKSFILFPVALRKRRKQAGDPTLLKLPPTPRLRRTGRGARRGKRDG